jgi:hypothetical protein
VETERHEYVDYLRSDLEMERHVELIVKRTDECSAVKRTEVKVTFFILKHDNDEGGENEEWFMTNFMQHSDAYQINKHVLYLRLQILCYSEHEMPIFLL